MAMMASASAGNAYVDSRDLEVEQDLIDPNDRVSEYPYSLRGYVTDPHVDSITRSLG